VWVVATFATLGKHGGEYYGSRIGAFGVVLRNLTARYFEALKAPRKQLVWFERSAHMPNTEENGRFNDFMIHTLLPALPGSGGPGPEQLRHEVAARGEA